MDHPYLRLACRDDYYSVSKVRGGSVLAVKLALFACVALSTMTLATLAHLVITDPKPLQLSVRPAFGYEPQDVFIQVRVQPTDDDRVLQVWTDAVTFTRSSAWTIEGAHSQALYSFWWKSVPAGSYTIVATLGSGTKIRARDHAEVLVISRY